MKRLLILSLVLASFSTPSYAAQKKPLPNAVCAPLIKHVSVIPGQMICRAGYVAIYDARNRIPEMVIYNNDRAKLSACGKRTDRFQRDESVSDGALPADYTGTGYDRGHMAPNNDMIYDPVIEEESFIMTNIVPQKPTLNRGIWKELETHAREKSYAVGNLTIITGVIYRPNNARLKGRVLIPDGFYKILVDHKAKTTETYIMYQNDKTGPISSYLSTRKEVQRLTGHRFNLDGYQDAKWTISYRNIHKECK
jgi:endonuclease G